LAIALYWLDLIFQSAFLSGTATKQGSRIFWTRYPGWGMVNGVLFS
jgi:hypothetical protein